MQEILHIGQWQGFFKYGPEYGDYVEGHEAEFRLFIEELKGDQFSGRIIDWEGLGAEGEVATVEGFVNDGLLSFTKKYAQMHTIDDLGHCAVEDELPGHKVEYEGRFDAQANSFFGTWEIITVVSDTPESTLEHVMTGTWRMQKKA